MTQDVPVPTPAHIAPRGLGMAITGLMFVLTLASLDQTIVATALPRIVSDLGAATQLSWVVTAYVLASTSTMPLYGKLSDQYGRKRVLFISIFVFLAGSVLCGMAQSMPQLIIFRGIQGLGSGGLMPLVQVTVSDLVSPRERGRYQGIFMAVFAGCSVAGPVIGGVITDLLSWHWIFYVNLPVGAVAIAMIAYSLPSHGKAVRRQIDFVGAGLLAAGTTCLLLVLSLGGALFPWGSPEIIGFGVAAIIMLGLLVVVERRVPEPVLPFHFFTNRIFTIASVAISLTFMALMGAGVFTPLFFQLVLGVAASHSGLLSGALTLGMVVTSLLGGRWMSRTGRYKPPAVIGLAMASGAYLSLGWAAAAGAGIPVVEPILAVLGMGFGLVMGNVTVAVQNAVEVGDRGAATATLGFFRSVGGVVGIAMAGAIMIAELRSRLALSNITSLGSGSDVLDQGIGRMAALDAPTRLALVDIYRHGIAMAFFAGGITVAIAFVVLFFLPELPLRSNNPGQGASPARESESHAVSLQE